MFLTNINVGLQVCFDVVVVDQEKPRTMAPGNSKPFSAISNCNTSVIGNPSRFLVSGFGGLKNSMFPLANIIVPYLSFSYSPVKLAKEVKAAAFQLSPEIISRKGSSNRITIAVDRTSSNEKLFEVWAKANNISVNEQHELVRRWVYEYSSVSHRIRKTAIEDKDQTENIFYAYDEITSTDKSANSFSFIPGLSIKIKIQDSADKCGASFDNKQYVNRLIRLLDLFVSFPQVALGPNKGLKTRREYGFATGLFRVLSKDRLEYLGASPAWLRNETTSRWMFGSSILAVRLATSQNLFGAVTTNINDDLIQSACNNLDKEAIRVLESRLINNLFELPKHIAGPNDVLNEEMLKPWKFLSENRDISSKVLNSFMPARYASKSLRYSLHGYLSGGEIDKDIRNKYGKFISKCS